MQLSFYKSWLIFSFFFTKKDPDFKRVLDVELIYCDCISCNWQKKRPKNSSRRRPSNWLTFTYLAPKENVHSAIFLVPFFKDSFLTPIWQNDGIYFFYWMLFLSFTVCNYVQDLFRTILHHASSMEVNQIILF